MSMSGWKVVVDLSAGKAAPGANTDILEAADITSGWASSADISVPERAHGCMLRFFVCFQNATVVKVVDDTGTSIAANNGVAIAADSGHTFDLVASKDRTYNLQVATDGIVRYVMVVAVWGASV